MLTYVKARGQAHHAMAKNNGFSMISRRAGMAKSKGEGC
jgi:hypothetical protein